MYASGMGPLSSVFLRAILTTPHVRGSTPGWSLYMCGGPLTDAKDSGDRRIRPANGISVKQ